MPPFVRAVLEVVIGLLLIALAWAIAEPLIDNATMLPRLPVVLQKAVELARSSEYLRHATDSGTALALGLLPALGVGLLVGACAGLSPVLRWLIAPLAVTLGTTPMFALVPSLIIWFGFTMVTKAVTVFAVAAFPVMTMMVATRAKAGGTSHVCAILANLRLGLVLGVSALVVVEFLASDRGAGQFILRSATMLDTTSAMAGFLLVAVPTIVMAAFLQAIQEQVTG